MSYANFGTPELRPEVQEFGQLCYMAGRQWGTVGNSKLPKHTQVGTVDLQVVGSINEAAKAFVRGWKETRPS